VTLGLQRNILTAGEGSAIVAAALASLALTAAGVTLLGRQTRAQVVPVSEPHPQPGS
jgi:uncharacterized membrane protein YfbV (UPF0208 family)